MWESCEFFIGFFGSFLRTLKSTSGTQNRHVGFISFSEKTEDD